MNDSKMTRTTIILLQLALAAPGLALGQTASRALQFEVPYEGRCVHIGLQGPALGYEARVPGGRILDLQYAILHALAGWDGRYAADKAGDQALLTSAGVSVTPLDFVARAGLDDKLGAIRAQRNLGTISLQQMALEHRAMIVDYAASVRYTDPGAAAYAVAAAAQSLSATMISSVRARIQGVAANGAQAFDGASAAPGGADAVAAPAAPAADDPARYAKVREDMISEGAKPQIVDAAIQEALRQGVDPTLVLSVIWQESRFNPRAKSPVGARGLMQVMPATGRDLGVARASSLYDVQTNLRVGINYLLYAADYLGLDVDLSDITQVPANKIKALLASYNAGIGAVSKWLRRQGQDLISIPYAETRHYVNVIGDKLASLVESLAW